MIAMAINKKWKSEKDFRNLADDFIGGAAKIASHGAKRATDQSGKQHRRDADHQRNSRAVNNSTQHIAAEIVGTEKIGLRAAFKPTRRPQTILQGLRLGIARRQSAARRPRKR